MGILPVPAAPDLQPGSPGDRRPAGGQYCRLRQVEGRVNLTEQLLGAQGRVSDMLLLLVLTGLL